MSWMVWAQLAGGVVLFLIGMHWLSGALRKAAGDRMRALLTAATESRWRGFSLGLTAGAIAQSTVSTVTTVGFVSAGLLSLTSALPVLFGANVGTTLSMQMISFRLTDIALAAVAIGGVVHLAWREGLVKTIGEAVLGFGLLFLGMKITGEAIAPYRDTLAPVLARIDGNSIPGLVIGVVIASAITVAMQSSGAVIGMVFVLAGSGAFTSLTQTYPIVLGAHIGTTFTGMTSSLGTCMEAKRAALANVLFNVFNATLGIFGARLFIPLLERTSSDLVHQTANAHTALMVVAAALLLPITPAVATLIRRVWPSREVEPPGSFLEPRLLKMPEDALVATLHELQRCTGFCVASFRHVNAAIRTRQFRALHHVTLNEHAVNEIKASVCSYVASLSRDYLSRRQALFAQALNRCAIELERISDHLDRLGAFLKSESDGDGARLDARASGEVLKLAELAEEVVRRLAQSFAPEGNSFDATSWAVLEARNAFVRESVPARAALNEWLARHEVPASRALAFSDYCVVLERIVRHCAVIAQEQRQPDFVIKLAKLGRPPGPKEKGVNDRRSTQDSSARTEAVVDRDDD